MRRAADDSKQESLIARRPSPSARNPGIGECNAGEFCKISALQHVRIAEKHRVMQRMKQHDNSLLSAKLLVDLYSHTMNASLKIHNKQ